MADYLDAPLEFVAGFRSLVQHIDALRRFYDAASG